MGVRGTELVGLGLAEDDAQTNDGAGQVERGSEVDGDRRDNRRSDGGDQSGVRNSLVWARPGDDAQTNDGAGGRNSLVWAWPGTMPRPTTGPARWNGAQG